jgi:uncharacterized protein (DUF1501 family)
MTPPFEISRRGLLRSGLAVGCSLAASPLITPVSLARVPGENRLVVIVLRGAMDALDVVQPYGDPGYAALRPTLRGGEAGGAADLDGFFSLHPGLSGLMPLWQKGELAFAHAVSTPYREKRSHFDGQDFLENGGYSTEGKLLPGRDGWLNRTVGLLPGADLTTAFSVGQQNMLLLDGKAPVSSWTPDSRLDLSPQARDLLALLYSRDPAFLEAAQQAFAIADMEAESPESMGGNPTVKLAEFAAEQLNRDTRIAAFSLGGWDTHRAQAAALPRALARLQAAILTLRERLGRNWERTAVVTITEFGRTARENGSKGTDHGTGALTLLAGGALAGAKVHGRWPGLREGDLFEGRDLMPTDDVRRPLAWVVAGLFGISRADVARTVFPELDMGGDPGILA